MLHPTRLPDCADLLERVLDFQEYVLELVCEHTNLSPDELRHVLGDNVFEWLDANKLLYKILDFTKRPLDEKKLFWTISDMTGNIFNIWMIRIFGFAC
ncbi:MAG: hypothetical protein D6694_02175 [Gammaproteobacteria bacterium]|nr:MAG: hypothetical protein D6694_02175 [Gammaproteobacteria bacterium]